MTAQTYPTKPLGEVLKFKNGKSIKPGTEGEFPAYGSNGLIGGSPEYREENAIILGRVGAYCGSVAYCPGKFWASDNTIVAYPKDESYDIRFLSYLLRDLNLNRWAGGAAQPLLTQTVLKQIEAPIPHLLEQQKIAAILSAYDDLIENNLRRIKILEEMAQNLYREWFVKFRFPGHEKVRMVDSPLGKIPEGWELGTIDELAVFENGDRGKNYPKSSEFVETGVPFINAGHLVGNVVDLQHVNRITESVFSRLSRGKIVSGDMLFCVRGTLGRIARVGSLTRGAIASSLVIIRSEDLGERSYLFYFLSGEQGQRLVKQLDNGAAQPNISVQSLKSSRLLIPTRHLLDRFGGLIQPIWQAVESFHKKTENLKKTRDLLLPKLISGELDVSGLDIDIGEAA